MDNELVKNFIFLLLKLIMKHFSLKKISMMKQIFILIKKKKMIKKNFSKK